MADKIIDHWQAIASDWCEKYNRALGEKHAAEDAAKAARLEGVRLGLQAALHEAATIRVALSGEQVGERRDMLDRIRALDPEKIAEGR